jgi:hypothetical protein
MQLKLFKQRIDVTAIKKLRPSKLRVCEPGFTITADPELIQTKSHPPAADGFTLF